ncbi:carbohydrate ABC transporter permease [Vallitalea sediminicola]
MMKKNTKTIKLKKYIKRFLFAIFFIFFVGGIIFPFVWQLLNSFKNQKDLFSIPPTFWPSEWTLQNYIDVFERQPFLLYLKNSTVISLVSTALSVSIGCLASYAVSRTDIKGKKIFMLVLLSITLLPPITIINPIYKMMKNLRLLNSYWGLALAITTTQLPMAVWFLSTFFKSAPNTLEESAMIDGASIFKCFYKIIMPLVAPGLFTVSILVFITAWNQYLFAQVLNPLKIRRTVTVGITLYQTDYTVPWGTMCAASIVITVPLIIVVLLLQRKIISGILDGGVKE